MGIVCLQNLVSGVNGLNHKRQVVIDFASGPTNAYTYSNMFVMELMKKRIRVATLDEDKEEVVMNRDYSSLNSPDNERVIIVNANVTITSRLMDSSTGTNKHRNNEYYD